MKILTLTLNPAYDLHCHLARFEPYRENLAAITSRDAGGKGVNISRALTQNEIPNSAIVVLGEENAEDFRRSLEEDGLVWTEIPVPGRIRENMTLHCDNAPETRISFGGFAADRTLIERVEKTLGTVDSDTVITLTGRVPQGVILSDVKAFLGRLRDHGAKIVIDSRSFSHSDLIECRPWLIKPNEEELAAYVGKREITDGDVRAFGKALFEAGIENVMVSLGGDGACLYCKDGFFKAVPPRIKPISTIGAGDSSIAGFLAAFASGETCAECLKTAVAYGTAACLNEGTKPPMLQEISAIYRLVEAKLVV